MLKNKILLLIGLSVALSAKDINLIKEFNKKKCPTKINKEYITICASLKNKGPEKVFYTLSADSNYIKNIAYNRAYYIEKAIGKEKSIEKENYKYTQYSMIHIAPRKTFNYGKDIYSMSNTIPFNKSKAEDIKKIEILEIKKSKELKYLIVLNIIEYKNSDIFSVDKLSRFKNTTEYYHTNNDLKTKKIILPTGLWKILSNKKKEYKECFYFPNDSKKNTFGNYSISCDKAPLLK